MKQEGNIGHRKFKWDTGNSIWDKGDIVKNSDIMEYSGIS